MKLEKRLDKINKVRKDGFVPGVIFGKEIESTAIQVDSASFIAAFKAYGKKKTFKVKLASKTHQVYFKDVQINLSKPQDILHFALLKVSASDTITAQIPIDLIGKREIETQGLIAHQIISALEVEYSANQSIDKIELDLSKLKLGDAIYVKDVTLPKGFKTNFAADEMIVNITYPKVKDTDEAEAKEETITKPTEEKEEQVS